MTTEREFDTLLRSWLDEEARSDPPARVLASVLGETGHSRQRPAWLVRLGGEPMRDAGRVGVHQMVPIALAGAVILLAVAIGIGVIARPDRNVGPSPVPLPSAVVTPNPVPLGGGLILTYAPHATQEPCNTGKGWYDVLALDAASGTQTLLGSTGEGCTADRVAFQWSQDRTRVLMTDMFGEGALPLEAATDAGRKLSFICCDLPDVWRDTGFRSGDGWVLSPRGDRVAALSESNVQIPGQGTTTVVDGVVLANIDGSGERSFALPSGSNVRGGGVRWSLDESAIAVAGCLPCNTAEHGKPPNAVNHDHVFVVPLDGSPVRQLLDDAQGGFGAPAWSPDGAWFLVAQADCQVGEMIPDCNNERLTFSIISVAVSDATHRTLITANQLGAVEQIGPPAFSPDGSRIAFSAWSGDGMDSNVFVMDPDGRNLVQLVAGSFPQWSPDGEWLLFSKPHADLFLDLDTWIIGADGKNLRHIGVFAGGAW